MKNLPQDQCKQDVIVYHDDKQSHLICIGPEGDFSSAEVQIAIKNGFQCISVGDSRLRTETAGVVASTLINL